MTDAAIIAYFARAHILQRHGRTLAIRKRGRRACNIIGANAYDAAVMREALRRRRSNFYPMTFPIWT